MKKPTRMAKIKSVKRNQINWEKEKRKQPNFTKKGPGRIHKYGDSPKVRSSTHDEQPGDRNNFISRPDSLDDRKWKLGLMAVRERNRRNVLNRLSTGRTERFAKG